MPHHYQKIIHNLINWERVAERLSRYEHIRREFPIETLRQEKYTNSAPYYCHPVAYRLGVWNSEGELQHFDSLLAHASTIQNWKSKGRLNITTNFQSLYNLEWELQVAKLLSDLPIDRICWLQSGPDLKVTLDGSTLYVECYCYQKFYDKIAFLDDVLCRIDPRLTVKCSWALKAQFPTSNAAYADLLESLLPGLTPDFIHTLESQYQRYIYLHRPEGISNVYVYFENKSVPLSCHSVPHFGVGDTDLAFKTALDEALRAKAESNQLDQHRPNIVAINMAMSRNFLSGRSRAVDLKSPQPLVELPDNIDGAVIQVTNADDPYSFDSVFKGSQAERLWQKMIRGVRQNRGSALGRHQKGASKSCQTNVVR